MAGEHAQAWHENPDRLREALHFTAAKSAFGVRLIEKDYYSSLMLRELAPLFSKGLAFKGGTALSKIHAGFYRLSEDLDFAISLPVDASRATRRSAIRPVKEHLQGVCADLTCLVETRPLNGANQSSHYSALYSYRSCLSGDAEVILFEVGLREPLVDAIEAALAKTILINPLTMEPAIEPIPVMAMSRREAYAEKIRAALTRREPAIRDFYDLDYAIQAAVLDPVDSQLLQLVKRKLAVPGNEAPDISPVRVDALRRQVEPQLRPVLRESDFLAFEIDRVVDVLRSLNL